MTIGSRLKIFRKSLGVDQERLALLTSVKIRTYAGYERGETEPRVSFLAALAALGCDVTWLITGVEPQVPGTERPKAPFRLTPFAAALSVKDDGLTVELTIACGSPEEADAFFEHVAAGLRSREVHFDTLGTPIVVGSETVQ